MSQNVLDRDAKNRFWKVVEECLVRFHGYQYCDAQRETAELRGRLENTPSGLSAEMVYHDEPFDVAGDIAGQRLDLSQKRSEYEAIVKTQDW